MNHIKFILLATSFAASLAQSIAFASCSNHMTPTTPDGRFSLIKSGTIVKDNTTRLMWKRCSEGKKGTDCTIKISAPSGVNAHGDGQYKFSFSEALGYASSHRFGGYSNWRLPNIKELRSIVEESCYLPSINSNIFPSTNGASPYWTNTSNQNSRLGGSAWAVVFDEGASISKYMATGNFIRLVRDID